MKKILRAGISLVLIAVFIQTVAATYYSDTSRNLCGSERFNAIMYAGDNHIMVGTAPNIFSPDNILTRSQAVMILYSLADYPDEIYDIEFTDVHESDWFAYAVNWAVHHGITAGTSSTTFSPNANVTREQFVAFLYKYAINIEQLTFNTSSFVSLNNYSDGAQVSSSLLTPFRWAVTYGIIQPDASNKIYPKSHPNRGDTALFMCRYDKNAVGFFDGRKKYNGVNLEMTNSMST